MARSCRLGDSTEREREKQRLIAGVRDGSIAAFVNYGHDLPDTSDLDCPYCGGSGHKDDVRGETWLPIATAPKDGTPVLCFTPDNDFSAITGIDVLWWDDDDWLYAGSPVAFQPTHWMPLPAAPPSPAAVDDNKAPDDARYGDSHIGTEPPTACMNWAGWDASNLPWSAAHHQDRVCRAVFGEAWSMGQANKLISLIERTWSTPNRAEPPADHIPDAKKMVATTAQTEPPPAYPAEEREACAKVAESFGPNRPLQCKRPIPERIIGRWEGEQAASAAIAAAIRARDVLNTPSSIRRREGGDG